MHLANASQATHRPRRGLRSFVVGGSHQDSGEPLPPRRRKRPLTLDLNHHYRQAAPDQFKRTYLKAVSGTIWHWPGHNCPRFQSSSGIVSRRQRQSSRTPP